ncbi:deoxyribodipyrimidine photo-lyase [Edwardsiella piscicida]|uniref:deoxyribodipyrimidine photo-lyase n=1 Tax=Edwardsiella piscicida TaxID=1263550 RepID=UPI000934DB04|nr:deoxyribodipyrimidine photo-lyase [Edwardsiella piscicida]WAM43884.1 deoxyribodipyrimidine photo-lyase [Edwardsiella piscicida]
MRTHVVWLRSDLRMTDNRALHAACADARARVVALYVATPRQWLAQEMAPRQAQFIWQNLSALQEALGQRQIPLYCLSVDDYAAQARTVREVCLRERADALFANRQYELNERRRDDALAAALPFPCHFFDDALLLAPGAVLTGAGAMFKVFTPFKRAFLRGLASADLRVLPAPSPRQPIAAAPTPVARVDYPDAAVDSALFPAGETAAQARLAQFCHGALATYAARRDFPAQAGTSQLSPYLTLGVLSPRQCLAALQAQALASPSPSSGAEAWLNELIWREFYRHLLVAWPDLCRHRPFIPWTARLRWRDDPAGLQRWQQGMTGFPLVDAAMRQLNRCGWMHNRLRMLTASFLVKDLLIDWRLGERYFLRQLIDGDLAANNGGWQWAASTGSDAAPYFRIFNPRVQGQRYDPQGQFIRRWLPELREVPDSDIHHPQRWALRQRRVLDYPDPLVDHARARQDTLLAFARARAGDDGAA